MYPGRKLVKVQTGIDRYIYVAALNNANDSISLVSAPAVHATMQHHTVNQKITKSDSVNFVYVNFPTV